MSKKEKRVQQLLADSGIELTPDEVKHLIRQLRDSQKALKRHGFCLSELTLEEMQQLCRYFAEDGIEMTLDELREVSGIAKKLRDMKDI